MSTILAVDDEVLNLEMVEYALQSEYEVIAVKSGEMALKYLKDQTPDLILLDIRMPQMDGMEVYRLIREQERLREIPVIFLTAANDVDTEDNCFEMGAVDFISKPFEPKIILRRIKRTLELIERSNQREAETVRYVENKEDYTAAETLAITINGMNTQFFMKDIYYIEVFNNTCIVRTVNREVAVRETLDRMQSRLNADFVRAGRSYLINVRYVSKLMDDIVVMHNGKRIKLPRRNKKEIVQDILQRTETIHHRI